MTEKQAKERAHEIMVAMLPLSWIEVGDTNKTTPKAVKLRDHLAKVLLQVQAEQRKADAAIAMNFRRLCDTPPGVAHACRLSSGNTVIHPADHVCIAAVISQGAES